MMRFLVALLLLPIQALADDWPQELLDLARLDEMTEVIIAEGLADNATMPEDYIGISIPGSWSKELERIYDPAVLNDLVTREFLARSETLDPVHTRSYLQSSAWQETLNFELEARYALMDPSVADAALAYYWERFEAGDKRLDVLDRLVAQSSLVEGNVIGAMNSMYQFELGLIDGGLDLGFTEDELLQQIWAEEESLRYDVSEWVYSFLLFAYDPVPNRDIKAQIDFFDTRNGRIFNAALFGAFDRAYEQISYELGKALAEVAQEQTL